MRILLFLFVMFGYCMSAQSDEKPFNVSYKSVLGLPFEQPAQTVTYGTSAYQFASHWPPNQDVPRLPALVIFVHGGCWLNAFDIGHARPLMTALSNAGLDVWGIEYRRTGDAGGGWPGSLHDVNAAIETILARYTEAQYRPKTYLVGHSAGGHLSLLAAQQSSAIDRVIGLAAITDIVQYSQGENSCQSATTEFMNGTPDQLPEIYADASPELSGLSAKGLLLHGTADNIVPLTQSASKPISYISVKGAGHFDWIHPKTVAFNVLLSSIKQSLENNQ